MPRVEARQKKQNQGHNTETKARHQNVEARPRQNFCYLFLLLHLLLLQNTKWVKTMFTK